MQNEVQRQLGALGLATRADLDALERRLTRGEAAEAKKAGPAKKAGTGEEGRGREEEGGGQDGAEGRLTARVRRRLDVELVRRGLVPSRTRAVEVIDAGRVLVGGAPASTRGAPGRRRRSDRVLAEEGPDRTCRAAGTSSRPALDAFAVDVHGRRAVDVGASTGGFTDCLLQRGAAHVVAIDVGRGAARVVAAQRPARHGDGAHQRAATLEPGALDPPPDLCVADLSFISLRTVAPQPARAHDPTTPTSCCW